MLFDSDRTEDGELLRGGGRFTRLAVKFPDSTPDAKSLGGLMLLVYVGDMVQPTVRAKLADVIAQGGERPINLQVSRHDRVRVVLVDSDGAWTKSPKIEVALS